MQHRLPIASDDEELLELVRRFGGVLSPALFDPRYERLRCAEAPGLVALRRCPGGVAVVIGDPVCPPSARERMLTALRARFPALIVIGASPALAALAQRCGFAAIELGEEVTIDPRRERPHGRRGHELHHKLNRAQAAGLQVHEHVATGDPRVELEMVHVTRRWLASRRGLQLFVTGVDLFHPRALRRWFYVGAHGSVAGVQSLVRLDARGGYLFEHLVTVPAAPTGAAELLVAGTLDALAAEGCALATFGISSAGRLGQVSGFPAESIRLGRWLYDQAQHGLHLDSVGRFRRKFGHVVVEPSYLLLGPPHVGLRQLYALLRACNASLAL